MITSKYNRLQVCIDILCLLVIINCVSELNNIAQPTKRKNVRASIKVALIRDPKGGGTRPELQNDREEDKRTNLYPQATEEQTTNSDDGSLPRL